LADCESWTVLAVHSVDSNEVQPSACSP
jgi:hypothetical protein